jgi:hypothetical protein
MTFRHDYFVAHCETLLVNYRARAVLNGRKNSRMISRAIMQKQAIDNDTARQRRQRSVKFCREHRSFVNAAMLTTIRPPGRVSKTNAKSIKMAMI